MHLSRIGRYIIQGVLMVVVLGAVLLFIAQLMAKKSVTHFLEDKLPSHMQLEYGDIDVSVLKGMAKLKTINFSITPKDSLQKGVTAKIDAIELVGLSYWQFLLNEKISLKSLKIERPVLLYYLKKDKVDTVEAKDNHIALLKTIQVKRINVIDGDVTLRKSENDSLAMKLDSVHIDVEDVLTNAELINSKIPVTYSALDFSASSLYADLGPYEALKVGKINVDEGNLTITELKLKSKYNKTKLSWHTNKERDYIDLKIPEIRFDDIVFGYTNNKLWVHTGAGSLIAPKLEMYRDKLLPDDTERKKLFGEAIRTLPIEIDIPKIELTKGYIAYSERVNRETPPGKIIFDKVQAEILNIQNVPDKKKETRVAAKALLMGEAPITLNWSFDAKNESDAFMASGTVKNFQSRNINSFLESNLRVRAKGEIQELYFTVSGNSVSSAGDMKMKYENFEFSVLKKDRLQINKLLTAIGRIFVNDGSNTDANGYRYGGIQVQRDPTKSFFNYIWLNVGDGLTATIIGNGKNERRKK
ncbi:hypothetical protein [Zobellia uliginosa]|uniref:hypothetical protein n=1 Tax=Zobellia uliginosa TaxID=143224 RepID=UPI001C07E4E3|nr:hypothetical protein [Zobellia uliginosa]MBU2947451.1 hypothetical protein [Zobellia uliginosa]